MAAETQPQMPAYVSDDDVANIAFEAASNAIRGGLTKRQLAMVARICLDQADISDLANALTEELR